MTADTQWLQIAVDLEKAIESAQRCSLKWQAWQQLLHIDEHGLQHVHPYTLKAIATLEKAYALDERDGEIIHHLAIAHHALAWDLELEGSPLASETWQKALFYWQRLQSCESFWQALYAKGETLGEAFDRRQIEQFRQDLYRYLLEIHVFLIGRYHSLKKSGQAHRHIELIKRARIPPKVRKELEPLVYQSMASLVHELAAAGRFSDALDLLDAFLDLFPTYLAALQEYLELTKWWVEPLAAASRWDEILKLDERVLPRWNAMAALKETSIQPAAQAALCELASTLGDKHWTKARNLRLQREQASQNPSGLESDEFQAWEKAIAWLMRCETPGTRERFNLWQALLYRADIVTFAATYSNDLDASFQLLRDALSDCQKAMEIAPDEAPPKKLAAQILQIRADHRLKSLAVPGHDLDFVACLREAEEDLVHALRYDSDNPALQEMLTFVRDSLVDTCCSTGI